jgi:purine/pyrimidine-nucleoside phosphorylase
MSKPLNGLISPQANIYFDGKCISHTLEMPNGLRKSVGVIFPSSLTFNTQEREFMEVVHGSCRVRLQDTTEWRSYSPGQHFTVPENSAFDIETEEVLHYICHFDLM